jgi:FAD-dependent urate hydroxylase
MSESGKRISSILLLLTVEGGCITVKHTDPAVVIGAGPYGLAVGAHLKAKGVPTLIFGKPMEFWKKMPPKMNLKSSWSALSISDPAGAYSLNRFSRIAGIPKQEPVPLQTFLQYGDWFQQQVLPDIDQTYVRYLTRDGDGFHLDMEDGRSIKASKVVVATGISSFAFIPQPLAHLPSSLASHNQEHSDFSQFEGKRVIVVGSGQSALEAAALLHEANASVELIARGPVLWIDRRLHSSTGPMKRLFYPPSDVGPPGVNWLVAFPLFFRNFPDKARVALDSRAVRPAGASWLRPRVEGQVHITENTSIVSAREQGQGVLLKLSDGTTREVDHVIMGTGYRANIDTLDFIDASLRQQIQQYDGYPLLNEWFESSVNDLHFTGALAGYVFGPLCRFVVGSKVAARQIARHIAAW